MSEATVLLAAVEQGDSKAAAELLELVYDELRRLASAKMAQQAPGQTLQPTALVHEAWLRLAGAKNPTFRNSTHFFAAAAEAMRHILIDRARRKQAERHGGRLERVEFDEVQFAASSPDDELLAVHEVLDAFSIQYPVQAKLVKLRYFAGMTNEEASQVLGISLAPGSSSKSEPNKSFLFSHRLEFSPWILVYLHEDVPDMETRPKQIRTQTGPFVLPNPRGGKTLNALLTLQTSELESHGTMGLSRVVRTLPCPEVIEERNRMAREIHDTLAQQFAGIFLNLEAANRLDNPQPQNISEYLDRAKNLAKCGLEDARRMLLGLRPKSLEGTQLYDALKELAKNFSRDCGIECSFCSSGRAHKIPQRAQNELYRVTQEALCNVRKHSGARLVSILLSYGSGCVLLAIKDDGQGFVVKKTEAGAQGFGLPTMGERANRLGGKMDINTGQGTGTEIRICVPLSGKTSKERICQ